MSSMPTVLDVLARSGDRDVFWDQRGPVTARQALATVYRLARALVEHGHGPGRIAGLLGPSSIRTYLLSIAVELTGGGQVELPITLPAADQARLATDCGVRLMLADAGTVPGPKLRTFAAVPGGLLTLGPAAYGEDLLAAAQAYPAGPFQPRGRPGDPDRINLTGGTTGRAKPVLRRFPAVQPPRATWLVRHMEDGAGPAVVLKTGRLTGLGRALANAAVTAGGRFITRADFDPAEITAILRAHDVTHLALSPYELRLLLDHPGLAGVSAPHLRSVITATMGTPPALLERAVGRFGPIIHPSYGQTEAGHITWLGPADYATGAPETRRSCGRPLPGVSVEIRAPHGRPLAPGRRGEIWVSTPTMMDAYWNRPDDTARAVQAGWLCTGDIGFLDPGGLLTVLGRSGEAIMIDGRPVFPSEVDTLLPEHPAVRESATFDVPAAHGTALHTAIVTDRGGELRDADLRELLSSRIASEHMPASFLVVPHIPLTYANEPCRTTLRMWHAQVGSGSMRMAPQGHSSAQSPQPLQ